MTDKKHPTGEAEDDLPKAADGDAGGSPEKGHDSAADQPEPEALPAAEQPAEGLAEKSVSEETLSMETAADTDEPINSAETAAAEAATAAVPEPEIARASTGAGHPPSRPTAKRGFPWFGSLLLLLVLIAMGGVGYLGWRGYEFLLQDATKDKRIADLQAELQQQSEQLNLLNQQQNKAIALVQQQAAGNSERLQAAEQRIIAQNKRLLAMSTVTREDWLLAEAEYLLKLANQRVLIERSAEGAEALLTEADSILRELDDPDLFALRKAVNSDLAALRLVEKIDVEGLYLAINGLIDQLPSLPLRPTRAQVLDQIDTAEPDQDTSNLNWWQKVRLSFSRFFQGLKQFVRVRDHSVEAKALLAPDTTQYLLHNIRLILERAQLALLREQPEIYRQSLVQAQDYIERYYPQSQPASLYREQLRTLADKTIVTELPDISPSLELLHSYIEALHDLKGAKPAGSDQP